MRNAIATAAACFILIGSASVPSPAAGSGDTLRHPVDRRSVLVGGQVAATGRYPYFVSLRNLSGRLVLTAAHCVPDDLKPAQKADFEKAGLNFTSFPNTYQPGRLDGNVTAFIGADRVESNASQGNPVALWFVHPYFDNSSLQYDIAVALLSTPDTRTPKVKVLDGAQDIYDTYSLTQQISAIGLGDRLSEAGNIYLLRHNTTYIDIDDDPNEKLEEVVLGTLVSRQKCGRALTNDTVRAVSKGNGNVRSPDTTIISMGQFCVQANAAAPSQPGIIRQRGNYTLATVASYADTCQGDSGGPVLVKGQSSVEDTLVGLISYGNGCGRNLPSVYTSVAGFLNATTFDDFLTNIMGKISD